LENEAATRNKEMEKVRQENESLRKENERLKTENERLKQDLLNFKKTNRSSSPKKTGVGNR
jgi:regulator of replication initiation timing